MGETANAEESRLRFIRLRLSICEETEQDRDCGMMPLEISFIPP
jgi:hypothetical protein